MRPSLAVEELPGEVADVVALEVQPLQGALEGEDVARHAVQRAVRKVQLRHLEELTELTELT